MKTYSCPSSEKILHRKQKQKKNNVLADGEVTYNDMDLVRQTDAKNAIDKTLKQRGSSQGNENYKYTENLINLTIRELFHCLDFAFRHH